MTEFIEISSVQNDLVKFAVKLQNSKFRKLNKLIFADGMKTILGFIENKIEFEFLFLKKGNLLYKNAKAKKIVFVNDEILKKISSVKTPSDVCAIIKEPEIDKNIFYNLDKIVLLEDIKDAGNLGTVIRSAAAFSFNGIILFNNCVDLYNTKVIRSTAQNIFKLPIIQTSDIDFIKNLKKTHKIIATVVDSTESFYNCSFKDKFILAFGSESAGLSKGIKDLSDIKITLPMENDVESLNLAVCASICFALIKSKNR